MRKILSILICTIPGREALFKRLTIELTTQIEEAGLIGQIEMILYSSPKNESSIGLKMNHLKSLAKGEYICYFGDDDMPAPNYIKSISDVILNRSDENPLPDIITFSMDKFIDEEFFCTYKIKMDGGQIEIGDITYIDGVLLPLCPHKKELADLVSFPDKNFQSDIPYSDDLKKHIKIHHFIDEVLYNYYYSPSKSAAVNNV